MTPLPLLLIALTLALGCESELPLLTHRWSSGSCCGPNGQIQSDNTTAYIAQVGWLPRSERRPSYTNGANYHGPCTAICAPSYQGCSRLPGRDTAPSYKQCATGDFCNWGIFANECVLMPAVDNPQVRVAKGLGPRGYDSVRVSLISRGSSVGGGPSGGFDYDADFQYRWLQFRLSSSLISATPGASTSFSYTMHLAEGMSVTKTLTFTLPAKGVGTSGVLIADPCINDGMGSNILYCSNFRRFRTNEWIPGLLNAFASDSSISFWGTLGDNWYDAHSNLIGGARKTDGDNVRFVYSRLSSETLSKIQLMVPGNHDLWDCTREGYPIVCPASTRDPGGWGVAQYYGQDVIASTAVSPYNFSQAPSARGWSVVAPQENFFFYNQIGDMGFIGFNGAPSELGYDALRPSFEMACTWMGAQADIKVVFMLSHYDNVGFGSTADTTGPGAYLKVREMPGCDQFDANGMLKFVVGHTHCNSKDLYATEAPVVGVGTGFRVAGMGMAAGGGEPGAECEKMSANNNFGIPVFDTAGGRLQIWHFKVGDTTDSAAELEARYEAIVSCVRANGWRACTAMAEVWLDQPLV